MKILIRSDSSFQIGTGHITRNISLALSLKEIGHEILFVCRSMSGNIISIIEEKQFKVIRLTPPAIPTILAQSGASFWCGVNSSEEIQEFNKILTHEKPDWVIVDHYGLDKEWEINVISQSIKLFAIDDLHREHACHGLLDQNFNFNDPYLKKIPTDTKRFLGPEYAILPKEFNQMAPTPRDLEDLKNVLVFFGGIDLTGETLKFLEIIPKLKGESHFNIVVGKNNPLIERVKEVQSITPRTTLHIQVSNMASLMQETDLYIGAGGTITWERCYFGIPSLCISVAENQVEGAINLETANVHRYMGKSTSLTGKDYINEFENLTKDSNRLKKLSQQSLLLKVGSKTSEILSFFN